MTIFRLNYRISVTCKFWRENVWRYIRTLDAESYQLLSTYLAREDIGLLYEEKLTPKAERIRFVEDLFINLHQKSLLTKMILIYKFDISYMENHTWLRIFRKVSYALKSVTHLQFEAFGEFGKDLVHIILRAIPFLTTLIIRDGNLLGSTYVPGVLFKSSLTDLILDRSFRSMYYSSVEYSSLVDIKSMKAMPRLQRLELIGMNEKDYSGLQILTTLTRLSLKDNILLTQDSISQLTCLTNLKELDLSGTSMAVKDLSFPKAVNIVQNIVAPDIINEQGAKFYVVQNDEDLDDFQEDAFTLDF